MLDALEASVDESRAALAAGETDRLLDSLTAFSDILAEACGNSRMLKLLVDLRSVLLLIGNTSLRAPGREERSIAEHEAILAALRAGDAGGGRCGDRSATSTRSSTTRSSPPERRLAQTSAGRTSGAVACSSIASRCQAGNSRQHGWPAMKSS